ncbi:hypothetical protein EDD27_9944 [Nonomuraea polychroma]|uniref:Uncharacterized protein n=1 Tax=Nonomuraea polychroma TaxID=46176 RepID=A0A438MMN5_9ACTN|nr:hypothetical protein [Nonomuraea polychroma]RVX47024.1 hypothetical protein EDD27_9944 [Nonomuraea polychroma]
MNLSRSAFIRRWYFLSLGLAGAVLILLRFTTLRTTTADSTVLQSLSGITDNLIAAVLTSIIVGAAYIYLFPQDAAPAYETVSSRDIARVIADLCDNAREWSVRSRGANYFTSVTLPALVASALERGASIRMRVQCLDPDQPQLLAAYAESMSDIRSRVGTWSAARARLEVCASMLRAALHTKDAPRVTVEFGLSPSIWVMSLDLTDQVALVTGQNKGEDALLFRRESQFFKPYLDDFDISWKACRVVRPRLSKAIPTDPRKLAEQHFVILEEFYDSLEICRPSREELREIVRTLNREHDYA